MHPSQLWYSARTPGEFAAGGVVREPHGRRLLAVGDAATTTNFKDTGSGQFLRPAFGQLQQEFAGLNGGTSISLSLVRKPDQCRIDVRRGRPCYVPAILLYGTS